jgi:hypothetical protein
LRAACLRARSRPSETVLRAKQPFTTGIRSRKYFLFLGP